MMRGELDMGSADAVCVLLPDIEGDLCFSGQ